MSEDIVMDDPSNDGSEEPDKGPDSGVCVTSLIDLAACVTAKSISCEEIEQHRPPLDEAMLKKVAFLASPQDSTKVFPFAELTLRGDSTWNSGTRMFEENKVLDMRQVGFMVSALVGSANVAFTFEKQRITSSSCDYCPKKIWCSHMIAAILHRINHGDKVPIHAPVTESLSTLSHNKLQKLIQYAIDEDPGSVLRKIFRRFDEIRDVNSEINETEGLPDPTFGLGLDGRSNWELSLDDLKTNFRNACDNAVDAFPYCFKESVIKESRFYTRYLQRVVDLVQGDEIEAAGRVLIILATVATGPGFPDSKFSKKYKLFLKTIERMCTLYILQFTGEARSDLILTCREINKDINVTSEYSKWAELPPVLSLFPQESTEVPGVIDGKQTDMFYEPLCAAIDSDPSQELYHLAMLTSGSIRSYESTYDEPLPLMMMRFEAIRLWKNSKSGEEELVRLGIAILRKLLQITFKMSILSEQRRVRKGNKTNKENKQKRKAEDETEESGEPAAKKRKVTTPRKSARLRNTTGTSSSSTTRNLTVDPAESEPETVAAKDNEMDELMEIDTLMESVEPNAPAEWNEINTPLDRKILFDCLGKGQTEAIETSLPKETLCYCLLHVCCCIYKTNNLNRLLKGKEKEVLVLGTFRALELARLHTVAKTGHEISSEEHMALNSLESKLVDFYKENKDKLLTEHFSSAIHKLYMKMLSACNYNGSCFFENGLPMVLISYLTKDALMNRKVPENEHQARSLCLYTLCHSYRPFAIFEILNSGDNYHDRDTYRMIERCFSGIVTTFLQHLKDYSERNSWLLKLLKHYEKVQDGKALYQLWYELRKFPFICESDAVHTATVKFLLTCIQSQTKKESRCGISYYDTTDMMKKLCDKLGVVFTELVFSCWADLIKFFPSHKVDELSDEMLRFHPPENFLPANMVKMVFEFFSGKFEHDAQDLQMLKFFKDGDENLNKIFTLVKKNEVNYTPAALLFVAKKWMQKPSHTLKIPHGNLYSSEVEFLITRALQRLTQDQKSNDSISRHGYFLPSNSPNSHIQWVFQTFLDKPANVIAKSDQWLRVMDLIQETFSDDLPTVLSLCSSLENQKPLLKKCKSRFGEKVVQSINKAMLDRLDNIQHKQYDCFVSDLQKVKEYYTKCVTKGLEAFKLLLRNLKQEQKKKKKFLLKHYENVQDGKVLSRLFFELKEFPYLYDCEAIHVAVVKFILTCIRYRNEHGSSSCDLSVYQAVDMLEELCSKLGTKFTNIVLASWVDLTKYVPSHQLDRLFDKMVSFHHSDNPLSESMLQTVFEFFSGKFQHEVNNLQMLKFFEDGDEVLNKVFILIKENEVNYSARGLLYIAQKWRQNQSDSLQLPCDNIFSSDVEFLISCALRRIGLEHRADGLCRIEHFYGNFLPLDRPNSDIQWVFQTFLEKPTSVVVKSDQFTHILDLIHEAFSSDLPTILSLCSHLQKRKSLQQKCKSRFGEKVLQSITKAVFETLEKLQGKHYGSFLRELERVKEYYSMCVNDGLEAFKLLLEKVQEKYKRKRKLIAEMHSSFPSLMGKL